MYTFPSYACVTREPPRSCYYFTIKCLKNFTWTQRAYVSSSSASHKHTGPIHILSNDFKQQASRYSMFKRHMIQSAVMYEVMRVVIMFNGKHFWEKKYISLTDILSCTLDKFPFLKSFKYISKNNWHLFWRKMTWWHCVQYHSEMLHNARWHWLKNLALKCMIHKDVNKFQWKGDTCLWLFYKHVLHS